MGLSAVYLGEQTWENYLTDRARFAGFEKAVEQQTSGFEDAHARAGAMQFVLNENDYQIALESGFGAIAGSNAIESQDAAFSIELVIANLAAGIDRLNADFNLLLGDIIWKLEMHEETLSNLLHEIRLAEFEREARAYRSRAETAYLNGWYQEALADFLEAEKRNYPDFAVLRSIASIYLYHTVDLGKSFDYFCKAAKYSRPSDHRQSAESNYFAAIVCALRRQFKEGIEYLNEATQLNPNLFEAHYQRSSLAALLGESPLAIESLEHAIKGDPRYYERAKNDELFDGIRPQVQQLLDQLMEPVKKNLAEVTRDTTLLKRYVIATPDKRQTLSNMFENVEARVAEAKTYRSGIQFMKSISEVQGELQGIYDQFYKQYEIGTRDYVRSVAISPDGKLVACGFLYEGIKVWEVDSGIPLHTMRGHAASVNSISFSPDSQFLVSGSRDRTIRMWDVYAGRELRALESKDCGEVRSVTFSPDGEWLASGSTDSIVRIWRAITGREVQAMEGHEKPVTAVAFSPDGRFIASGSLDRTLKLWEASSGREIKSFEGHTEGVVSLAYSPDGNMLVSGGEDKMVRIWDVETAREIRSLPGHVNDVTSVAFNPSSELVAGGSLGQTIRIWKLSNGQLIKTLWFSEISWHPVAFSPKGQWMALASRDVQLWLKTLLTEEEYAEVKAGEERARLMKLETENLAHEVAELKRFEKEEAAREILRAARRAAGECEECGERLRFFRRLTRQARCKIHRLKFRLSAEDEPPRAYLG